MVEFANEKDLETWLNEKPRELSVAVAARTALRVVPLLVEAIEIDSETRRESLILPCFRALAAVALAGSSPGLAESLDAILFRINADVVSDIADLGAAPGARSAGKAIAAAVVVVRASRHADAEVAAFAASTGAANAALHAAWAARHWSSGSGADVWEAASRDADVVDSLPPGNATNPTSFLAQPLWHAGTPRYVMSAWERLKAHLLEADEGWEIWVDWYEGRLAGRHGEERLERAVAGVPQEDWEKVSPAHVNAIIKWMIEVHTPQPKQSEHGARWAISGDRLVIVPGSAEIGERATVLQPLALDALQELADEIGPSNQFAKLRGKAERALEIVRKSLPEVNQQSAALWALSVWLGDFAEWDDAVRRDQSSFAEALGEHQRVALNAAIRQTAAFARQFRTALELDVGDASFRRADFRIEPHREIVAEARAQDLIGPTDHETLEEMAEAAVGPAVQAAKASAGLTFSTRNLLFVAAFVLTPVTIISTSALQTLGNEIGHGLAEGTAVREKARRMAENAAAAIDEVIRASPPDLRYGLGPLRSSRPPPKP